LSSCSLEEQQTIKPVPIQAVAAVENSYKKEPPRLIRFLKLLISRRKVRLARSLLYLDAGNFRRHQSGR
jgi:hypothetical protein